MRLRMLAVNAAKKGASPPNPPEPPAAEQEDDFFPGTDSVRAWMALEDETRRVIQLSAGFFLLPALLSWALRATVIDPLLYLLQVSRSLWVFSGPVNALTLFFRGSALLPPAKLPGPELDAAPVERGQPRGGGAGAAPQIRRAHGSRTASE